MEGKSDFVQTFYVKQHPNLHVEEEIADDKWGAHPNKLFLFGFVD